MSTCKRRGPRGCQCKCSFVAGFAFRFGDCLLTFGVGDVFVDGVQRDIADADITVVINGPDGEETDIVDLGDTLYWERFQPVAGDVYTATVTLICGETTVERTYTSTIPEGVSPTCNCCTLRTLDYITINGFSNDFAAFNGTYAVLSKVNPSGLLGASCHYVVAQGEPPPSVPENPCGTGFGDDVGGPPISPDAQYQCRFAIVFPFEGFYYYPGSMEIAGWGSLGGEQFPLVHTIQNTLRIRITVYYILYRWRRVDSGGIITTFCELQSAATFWDFETPCEGGPMTLVSSDYGGAAGGALVACGTGGDPVPAIPYEDVPTVEVFWE